MRHLHDKVKTLESRTAPPPEDTSASESTSAAAAGLIMGGMMMTDTLMIQNGPAYGKWSLVECSLVGSRLLFQSSTLTLSLSLPLILFCRRGLRRTGGHS